MKTEGKIFHTIIKLHAMPHTVGFTTSHSHYSFSHFHFNQIFTWRVCVCMENCKEHHHHSIGFSFDWNLTQRWVIEVKWMGFDVDLLWIFGCVCVGVNDVSAYLSKFRRQLRKMDITRRVASINFNPKSSGYTPVHIHFWSTRLIYYLWMCHNVI